MGIFLDDLADSLINKANQDNLKGHEIYCDGDTIDGKYSKEYSEKRVKWWGMYYATRPHAERFDDANSAYHINILLALSRDPVPEIKEIAARRLYELQGKKKGGNGYNS